MKKSVNAILNAIAAMGLEEQELMLMVANMTFEEAVKVLEQKGDISSLNEDAPDKDLPSQDEEIYHNEWATYLQSWAMETNWFQEDRMLRKAMMVKAKKGRNHTTKAHKRDKAKAGKRSWGHHEEVVYNNFCMANKQKSDMHKDFQSQQDEAMSDKVSYDQKDIKNELSMVFDKNINGWELVLFHYANNFSFLAPWNIKVRSWMEQNLNNMPSEAEAYSYMEYNYPEMSMSEMKFIVEDFISNWRLSILMEASSMWRYCQSSYKDYYKKVEFQLQTVYDKLDDLTKKIHTAKSTEFITFVDEFNVLLAQIKSWKTHLEEMNEANAKYI